MIIKHNQELMLKTEQCASHCAGIPMFVITAQTGIQISLEHTTPYSMHLTLLQPAFTAIFFKLRLRTRIQCSHALAVETLDDLRAPSPFQSDVPHCRVMVADSDETQISISRQSQCARFGTGVHICLGAEGTLPQQFLFVCPPAYASFLSLFHLHRFLSTGPQPTDANSAGLVMKDVEVVVVEVVRVFVVQKGLWRPHCRLEQEWGSG